MTTAPVRIGLLGYGFGGRCFHAPLIAAAPECTLIGVVTQSTDRRAALGREHPGVPAYDSLADLAAAGAQAVAISTPASTHIPLTVEALRRRLPVVCDKPFALDAATAAGAVELAEAAALPLTVFQNRRWDSDLLTVRRLLAQGRLGTVTRFESRFERFAWGEGPPPSGGGTRLDFGSHLVDQALTLFGPVAQVYAEVATRQPDASCDDDVFLALAHTGGVRSHLWGSWVQGAPGPRFRVTGTVATYVVDGAGGQEDALIAGRSPATDGDDWGSEPERRWGVLHRGAASEVVPSERGRWDTFYPAFAAAVRGLGPVPVDPRDAVASLAVLDAAAVSAATGHTVAVSPAAGAVR